MGTSRLNIIQTFSLDLGEQAALSLMQSQPADMILTDDAAARLAAQSLSYRVHGTIGVVIRAIRRKQRTRDEVLDILRSIPSKSTLYVRASFLNSIISQVQSQTQVRLLQRDAPNLVLCPRRNTHNKICIQQDSTEEGIANELIDQGVSEDSIVLGFHREKLRHLTGLAVA